MIIKCSKYLICLAANKTVQNQRILRKALFGLPSMSVVMVMVCDVTQFAHQNVCEG